MSEPTTTETPPKTYREMLFDLWSSFDWSKSDYVLSKDLAVTPLTVNKWRFTVCSGKVPNRFAKYDVDFEALDWQKNDSLLSKEWKLSSSVIGAYRRRFSKPFPTVNAYNTILTGEKWDSVDWAQTKDVDIARQFGVTRERIRQLRAQLGKPDCMVKGLGSKAIEVLRWVRENRESLNGKSMREVSELVPHTGMVRSQVYELLHRTDVVFGPDVRKTYKGFNWDVLNWKLPNIVLGLIYGFPEYRIAITRNQRYKVYPDWRLGGFSKEIHDPELLAAITAEKAVAIANGVKVDEQRLDDWIKYKQSLKTWNDAQTHLKAV